MKKILTLLFLLCAISANAATRYASPSGSGSACTVIGTPCTLAVANGQMVAGDTLYLRSGTYSNAAGTLTVPLGTSWNAGEFTTYASYSTEVATFSGGFPFNTYSDSMGYVLFDGSGAGACAGGHACGLVFDNNTRGWNDAFATSSGARPVKIDSAEFKNIGANGILPSSGNNIFTRLYIHHGGCTDFDNAMYVGSSGTEISYTEITDYAGAAIQIYGSTVNNNMVHHNWIHDTSGGVNANIPGVGTCNGYTNGFRTQGIILYSGSGHRIYNNTISNLRIGAGGAMGGILYGGSASSPIIYNNTIYNNGVGVNEDGAHSGEVLKNNLIIDNATANIIGTWDTNSNNVTTGSAASHFVSTGSNNYSLVSGSGAIDAGVATIATGVTACANGSAPDAGAIESLGAPTASVNGTTATITVTNNCTSGMLPSTGVTGFTFKKNGSGDTVNTNVLSGANSYLATLNSAFVGGDTCLFSYSQTGNATSNNNIGGFATSNQELLAFTDVACTNDTSSTAAVALSHWRVYLLQGATDTAWVPKCNEDSTNCIVAPGSKLWIRNKLRNSSGSDFSAFNYRPNWRRNAGTYYPLSDGFDYGWACTNSIPPTCAVDIAGIKMIGTKGTQLGTVISNATPTTADQLTSNASNVSCSAILAASSIPSLALANSTETECAHGVEFAPTATPGDIYEMCPFTDTATALTCATPIKITIGSYQAVR